MANIKGDQLSSPYSNRIKYAKTKLEKFKMANYNSYYQLHSLFFIRTI